MTAQKLLLDTVARLERAAQAARAEAAQRMAALRELKVAVMMDGDAAPLNDQVLALVADLGDEDQVADICNAHGWQVNDTDGMRPFTEADVCCIVEIDAMPANRALRAMAKHRMLAWAPA